MSEQKKNVIIAGSTKCGTTSLFNYLKDHPAICASVNKETRFFWKGEYELSPINKNKTVENYNSFFFRCSENQWRLEATPDYLYSQATAKKIKEALPDCKLLFILRNPVERIFSWFKYSKQLGLLPTQFQLDDYLKLLQKCEHNSPAYLRALEQGKYASYLQQYFDLFNENNILILFQNDLQKAPFQMMHAICDFLEINSKIYEKYNFKIYNQSINFKSGKQSLKYVFLKQSVRKLMHKLPSKYTRSFKNIFNPLNTFYLKKASNAWDDINLSASYQKFVNEYYIEDHTLLEKICKKKIIW